ncbi:MAG: M48 family metalloprotease, partial [Rhodospirillaceae bacterium]|nr:M48 family metalloprotease [Rhodospirillaceae bacterium]
LGGSGLAFQLINRGYSRHAEREADLYGMKYMHRAGYDTRAAVTLQQKFVALSKGRRQDWLTGLFATHPPSTERVKNNRKALRKYPPGGDLGRQR